MNKVLVTGATGFIGKRLVEMLLQNRYQVRVLTRQPAIFAQFPPTVEVVTGDLTLPNSLLGVCSGIDTVFHLAGFAHAFEETDSRFEKQHYHVNYMGTKNILAEAERAGVKSFIYFSSVKAVADSHACIDESFEKTPNSPYGLAKRRAEKLVISAPMHTCVLRPALVYGPQWKGNLAALMRAIDRGVMPPLPDSKNRRSMVSVSDICHAALLAAHHPAAKGKIYFVTDNVYYSTRQLYELMCHALGKKIPRWHVPLKLFKFLAYLGDIGKKVLKQRLPFDSDAMAKLFGSAQYDSSRIQNELGFQPSYDLKKMLPEIVANYKS